MIKLIKVADMKGKDVHFNPDHLTRISPASERTSIITFSNGDAVEVNIHIDDLAGRITRVER